MIKNNLSLALLLLLFQSNITLASQRVALVIGNGDYNIAGGKLINPPRDAHAIAQQLEELGFQVQLEINLKNQEAMEMAVDQFTEQLSGKEIGLFYYAGHAVQLNNHNFLMPTQAYIKKAKQAKHRALDSAYLLDQMAIYKPQLSIVILDACRDNPFPKDSRSSASRGLGRMQAPSDMLISFSTKPGATADDGEGIHSPYTEMLLAYLKRAAHIPIQALFNQVGVAVETKTQNSQSPRLEMSPLHYNFCFSECANRLISPIVIQPNKQNSYFNDQNTWLIIASSLTLLSVVIGYSYYRKQQVPVAGTTSRTVKQTKVKPGKTRKKVAKTITQGKVQKPDLSACSQQAFAYLCEVKSNKAVAEIGPNDPVNIGRSSQSTICLKHNAISAHHAEISWHPGTKTFLLQDKGSTNGTWTENQIPLVKEQKTAVKRGEIFYLGHKTEAYYIW